MSVDLAKSVASASATTPPTSLHAHPNQFALLKQRRFAPFFWTQFSGAANDNLFKFAFTVMVTYQLSADWLPPALAGLAIGALFILPFLLFSATLGQLTGMVEMGTFVAILLGNIVGGLIVAVPGVGPHYVAMSCVLLALAGRAVAQFIPLAPATDPTLKINWNPISETWRNLKLANENRVV